ncbi:MAG: DUF4091 domain-containing protein [Dysgonamonadaceae bacterium]|jgi:hypothetical protein|nr:DUF4091 domain-containing protein [Dysgonamonadaceae bacterium]
MRTFILSLAVIALMAGCANSRPAKNFNTYAEAQDPAPDSTADWTKTGKKLNVSFGDINNRYAKSAIPAVEKTTEWAGAGWRGERLSAQLVLWTDEAVEQVECEFSNFKSSTAILDASIAQARFVRYTLADCYENRKCPPTLTPDVLDTLTSFNIESRTTRPMWLSFDIPQDAEAGVYLGTLTVYARKQKAQKLKITLEVQPQTLPEASQWAFHLDLWQHPASVARINNVKPWSEEHWKLLEEPMALLASAGQKVITATLNKDPWNHQCYDGYEDMIRWTKQKNGSWTYDYGVFDRWVELMLRIGIKKQINCYSMLPWNYELHYLDEASGKDVTVQAKPGEKTFNEMWTPFLKNFGAHLKQKGWEKITNIAMDERAPEEMKKLLDFLARTAPDIGVALADNHKSYKQFPAINDVCVFIDSRIDDADLVSRRAKNFVSTYYVCCGPKEPNTFTFSPLAESAWLGWYAASANFDGLLRWAYNSWNENPLVDSRFGGWAAGDCFLIYPNGRSSVRFERLREGIQDYEKIRILRQNLAPKSDNASKSALEKLNEAVASVNSGVKAENYAATLLNAKKILAEVSK